MDLLTSYAISLIVLTIAYVIYKIIIVAINKVTNCEHYEPGSFDCNRRQPRGTHSTVGSTSLSVLT
jgi:hypothetical protein